LILYNYSKKKDKKKTNILKKNKIKKVKLKLWYFCDRMHEIRTKWIQKVGEDKLTEMLIIIECVQFTYNKRITLYSIMKIKCKDTNKVNIHKKTNYM
jgi:hypothetical protein